MAAIYQWFKSGEYMVLTTTLYPIEASEALVFSIDISAGSMDTIKDDAMKQGMTLLAGTLVLGLLDAPERNDGIITKLEVLEGTLNIILLDAPEQDDAMDHSLELLSGTLEEKLVTTYSPPQGLIMDINLDAPNCSMTPV